jgi:D-2-hydroxyacid dehydrogenase (NADP+)
VELHTCLWHDVQALHFNRDDFEILRHALPGLTVVNHDNESSFLERAEPVEAVLTWEFNATWYQQFTNLKWIMTPAAGNDWVEADPTGQVSIIHGTFHGNLIAESLLSAILFMNHRMPEMWRNFANSGWDRDLQKESRLLREQTVLIIGYGNIGQVCGRMISQMGANVIGIARHARANPDNIPVYSVTELAAQLPLADHVVLMLPGSTDTDGLLNEKLIRCCKPGVYLYNFGRGNSLRSDDLINSWNHVGGAFLDVTEEEPLPESSALWKLDNIMITPHSSCIYASYKQAFLEEAIGHLRKLLKP